MPEHIRFLDRNPPSQPLVEVREVAERLFGICGDFETLDSERDQNCLVVSGNGKRHVVKISNADERREVVDFQVRALQHLAAVDSELPVPRVFHSIEGGAWATHRFLDGNEHVLHVLTFLPGIPLEETSVADDSATYRKLGAFMARVDCALRGFFHAAADQDHAWSISRCSRLAPLTCHIEAADDRAVVDAVFRQMAAVAPRLARLRHQVIHQDAHMGNVLVDEKDADRITGLIDFGDMLYGCLPAEIAVACDSIPVTADDLVTPACEIVSGYDETCELEEDELELVFDLVCARNAMTATIAAARAARTPHQPAHIASPLPYIDRLRKLQAVGRDEFTGELRSRCRFPAACPSKPAEALSTKREDELIAARRRLMGHKATHFYERPLHFERGIGPWLFATDGRRYLDCYNNVPQVGHCHPHVVRAIARQTAALNTNTRYLYSSALEYADRLTGKLAPHLDACLFVNSGSEANDVAWQMAKQVTGNSGGVIMEDAYHGVTDVIRHFSPGHPDSGLPDFLSGLIVPDPYRGPIREGTDDIAERYARDADRAVAELREAGHDIAAFMFDSAFCSSGVPAVPDGYLRAVERRIRAAGGLLICDEVQSGFGRMGQWWGHELHGVRADIVTMGKPVGNGHPLGVVVTTQEILNHFIDRTRLFSTFGGNTVACAAGNAVLDVIEREDLVVRGAATGERFRSALRDLAGRHELIGDVRGHGMVIGLEFVADRDLRTPARARTARLLEMMRERCVLVGSEGRDANILKLRPSLIFDDSHIDLFIEALDDCLLRL